MRKVTIKDVSEFYSVGEIVANDILRLAHEGELFTTDGKQITLEFIQRVFEHYRVFESINKDVMSKLQTSRIEGYTTTLHYAYRKMDYDFEDVKGYIIEELGSYGSYDELGQFHEWDIKLYPYSFEDEEMTFDSLCDYLASKEVYLDAEPKEVIRIMKENDIKKFLKLELTRVYDKDGKLLNIHTVKDEIKDFCFERKEKFTNEMVMKVFMTCKEISIKC